MAEIRKMGGGGANLLAKGRQRVEVQLEALDGRLDLSSVPVRVLPEPLLLAVPPEARAGMAWHVPRLDESYDPWQLAKRAKKLFHSIAPQVRRVVGCFPARSQRCSTGMQPALTNRTDGTLASSMCPGASIRREPTGAVVLPAQQLAR